MNKLNNKLEDLLKKIIDLYEDAPVNINSFFCERREIEYLIEQNYCKVQSKIDGVSGWLYFVYPTQEAIDYFNKEELENISPANTYNITTNNNYNFNAEKFSAKKSFNGQVEDSINISVGENKKSIFSRLFSWIFKKQ